MRPISTLAGMTKSQLCTVLFFALLCPALQAGAPKKGDTPLQPVRYRDFGAKGDGKTDDMDALIKAHDYANKHNRPVKAEDGATYYIGGKKKTIAIQTDTDFGSAKFIIDDTALAHRGSHVFVVQSTLKRVELAGIASLTRDQATIKASLPGDCLVRVSNSHVKHYIRYGRNQNKGSSQTDIFLVDKTGAVDPKTPILWDFDKVTELSVQPLDAGRLTIRGGHFTTIANRAESKYNYHQRNIAIRRSNVVVEGLTHHITGEGEHGAPYGGFLNIGDCANVTVKESVFTGHKTYQTIGSAGKPVSMGSYDILLSRALNVSFMNCRQTNDINDRTCWGVMASNYCKNLTYDGCAFSRFDAHKGVAHVTIRNSRLGHMGIKAIGRGTLLVEKTTVHSRRFIDLRSDYGSTWEGEVKIRDCVLAPPTPRGACVIGGQNTGQHDFGYPCYMPKRIVIENLLIKDGEGGGAYQGPALFADFNRRFTDDTYVERYPYAKTKEVLLKNVTTTSGKPLRLSDNPVMFKEVKVERIRER